MVILTRMVESAPGGRLHRDSYCPAPSDVIAQRPAMLLPSAQGTFPGGLRARVSDKIPPNL